MTPRAITIRLIYPVLTLGLFAFLPIAIAREDKCTNVETAYMIAKRMTVEHEALEKKDEPDFPWIDPAMASYEGGCTHLVRSFFDRKDGEGRQRTSYTARVHYDVIMNRWSLEDWQATGKTPIGARS